MPSKTQVLLASGRPIVASVPLQGAAARAVRHSDGGIVVEPENPTALAKGILELYHNPEKAALLGQKGRQYALQYLAFDQALDRYESLLQGLTCPLTDRALHLSNLNQAGSNLAF